MERIRVQLEFVEQTERGEFRDAIYFHLDEYLALSDERKQELKQERIQKWHDVLDASPDLTPTAEEVLLENMSDAEREQYRLEKLAEELYGE